MNEEENDRAFGPDDDYPHPVPPQAFMMWKENWVFPSVDPANKVACLFHFSLRPGLGEGIFTAKFAVDGWEHRYVGRSPVPRDLSTFRPVQNERLTFTVVKPAEEFHIVYTSDELDADITYTARFPAWDFKKPVNPGTSDLGGVGQHVFPFHHMEQSLQHDGVIKIKSGPLDGKTINISGYANRDHSWGWREDLTFHHHHWLCASFDDRFIEGSVMEEEHYPHGEKVGGWTSTAAGNSATVVHGHLGRVLARRRRAAAGTGPRRALPRHQRERPDRDRDRAHRLVGVRPPLPGRPVEGPQDGLPGRPDVL